MAEHAIEPLNDSSLLDAIPEAADGPYALDVTITLTSGGTISFAGRGLDRVGMHELLTIIERAVDVE